MYVGVYEVCVCVQEREREWMSEGVCCHVCIFLYVCVALTHDLYRSLTLFLTHTIWWWWQRQWRWWAFFSLCQPNPLIRILLNWSNSRRNLFKVPHSGAGPRTIWLGRKLLNNIVTPVYICINVLVPLCVCVYTCEFCDQTMGKWETNNYSSKFSELYWLLLSFNNIILAEKKLDNTDKLATHALGVNHCWLTIWNLVSANQHLMGIHFSLFL